ncbi:MAG: hypothetical protein CBB92_02375 [Flammeovirgaceae bacterium TMED32]|nr:MAG: hypothetical protein CBB92_02375 [Flammeovirgaceae bacterium TMED32]
MKKVPLNSTRAFENKILYYGYMKKFLAREILIGTGILGALILEYLVLSALFGYEVSDRYLGLSLRIIMILVYGIRPLFMAIRWSIGVLKSNDM